MLPFPGTRGFSPKIFTQLVIILCLGSECAPLNAQTASPSPSTGREPAELNQITVTAVPPKIKLFRLHGRLTPCSGRTWASSIPHGRSTLLLAHSSKIARFSPFRISANFRPVPILQRNTVWMASHISAASMRNFSRTDSEKFFIEIALFRASIKWSRSTF